MSLKKWLINRVKYSQTLYNIYYYIGTLAIRFLKVFVRADDKLILFSSFGGRKFDDSPKKIYDAMLSDPRFEGYRLVWAFLDRQKFAIPKGGKIATDGLRYYITALKARVWITNSSIERGLSFKGRKTFYFNTWHGTPIKKMGGDIAADNKSFGAKGRNRVDIMTAQGQFEADIFSRVFRISRDRFRVVGLPRNDSLTRVDSSYRAELRERLNIPKGKIVIFYAPTFREYNQSSQGVALCLPIDFKLWQERLGGDYIVLFRAHYEVAKSMKIEETEFLRDVSSYPVLEDLMIASDVLISDYSSIFFDYSIMGKPMLCFAYDYDEYAEKRGMYFDIREQLPNAENEDELLDLIMKTPVGTPAPSTIAFRDKYVTEYGHAAEKSLDIIAKELNPLAELIC